MELRQCSGPINKQAALGIKHGKSKTTLHECPGLIEENFYELQKRLYGALFCKDITGWVVGDIVVWGLYGFGREREKDIPYIRLMNSKWVCKCRCGSWQILRYKKVIEMKKGTRQAVCEKCLQGWKILDE